MSTLRIATDNLLQGGQDGRDRSRLDAALEVLHEAAPQVVPSRRTPCPAWSLLVSPPLADGIVGHRVIRDERTDHYPVVVDLEPPLRGA